MAVWVCRDCTAKYAVGLSRCPHCRAESSYELEGAMSPKISKAGGPSNAAAGDQEDTWPGNSTETSSEKPSTSIEPSEPGDQLPAPTTESLSSPDPAGTSSADSTDGASGTSPESADQPELKGAELDQALADRGLSKSGSADEKRSRVAEHDAARVAEQTGE